MHLFAVGWGLSDELERRLVDELRHTARVYPHLDPSTHWTVTSTGGIVATGQTSARAMIAPREYVHDDGDVVTLFDGLPLAPRDPLPAHRASELAGAWDRLADCLEGRFLALRLSRSAGTVEALTDPLGVGQLYVWETAGSSIVSNSAGLVARAVRATEVDPLAVSTFLTMDQVTGDRTLRRDVRVAPGGQHWSWHLGDRTWTRRSYWTWNRADPFPERRWSDDVADEIIDGIRPFVDAAAGVTGSINAPLTGGKDSRMLAAILMSAGIDASYWTKGDAGSADVGIALDIARRYGLRHRIANRPTQPEEGRDPTRDVAAAWPELTREFVLQNDGLASIFLVGNIQGQPKRLDRLAVTLTAMCAESARAMFGQAYLCAPDTTRARMRHYMPYTETQTPRGLVHRDAYAATRRALRDWVDGLGPVPVPNIPTFQYLDFRCRRWASMNPRELAQTEDKVLPFLTRAYVESVLSLHVDERATHQLHRGVIRRLRPELEHDPPLDSPWYPVPAKRTGRARGLYNHVMASLPYPARRLVTTARDAVRSPSVARTPASPYDEESWLEANLDHARETMLGRSASPLWSFVDRRMLERMLAADTAPRTRRLHQLPLFAAYTMFLHEAIEAELAARRP